MPKPNAIVSTVIRLELPSDRPLAEAMRADDGLWVGLEGEQRVRLDPDDERSGGFAQVLDGLRRQGLPVYLEFDPDTSAVTALRVPHVSPVIAVQRIDRGVLDVVLANSHARHFLRESAENFELLRGQVDEAIRSGAALILVEDDAHDIIDLRLAPKDFPLPWPPFPKLPPRPKWPWRWFWDLRELLRIVWWWPLWPWWWFRCISATRAQQVFDDMQATSCAPLTVPTPCIPFLFPDDGCWARANEMCRLMQAQGLRPRKVWIQGWLVVATRNNPNCSVSWGWHVAPTLCVRGPGFLDHQDMVIDPSLFTTPVTKAQWKAVQSPTATLTDTDASIYMYFSSPTGTDPGYTQTNYWLAYFRLQLQARSVSQGPPPYANCP